MSESLLVAGVVCIVAAIVGGGIKLLGAEVPVLNSFPRQALLFVVGAGFLLASFRVGANRSPTPSPPSPAQAAAQAPAQTPTSASVQAPPSAPSGAVAPCGAAAALSCLPRSSSPVVFVDEAAANRAASQNIQDSLSTTQAQAEAIREGASGKASRLCGIVGSNDSSPLGKHLAAIRLNNPQPADGQSTPACLKLAQSFF
ncbi:MAG TPA: hypothetical protein VKQ27_12450 [Acetobacteraceae bacterium]|nr:hypothetical protein [Acetobacteraceae bacterium]